MQVHFRQAASSCNSIHLHTLTMACNYITYSHACLRACTPAYIMYRYKPVHAYVFAYTYCIIHTCMHACMHACIYTYILSTFLHTYIPTCLHTHLHIAYIYAQRVYISVSAEPPWQYVHEGHTSMHEFCEDALALSMRIQIKIIKIKLCKCFLRWPYDSCLLWFCCWHRKILCTCRVSSPPLCWVFPLSVDF